MGAQEVANAQRVAETQAYKPYNLGLLLLSKQRLMLRLFKLSLVQPHYLVRLHIDRLLQMLPEQV